MKSKNNGLYFGSVAFTGLGGFREKMVSQLLAEDIQVRNIEFSGVEVKGEVSPTDYYRTAEIARKNGVRIRSGKRRGLYFALSRRRRRIGLYVGMLVFMLTLTLWQTRVQSISIEGDVSQAQIMSILKECGIFHGAHIEKLNTSAAEYKIMLEVDNCAWADVSCTGFRVNVRVEKGTEMPELETSEPRNLIASRPAQIVSRIVRRGAGTAEVGSGVNTGDLLISGTVFDGKENILTVRAEGEVIGEWQETAEFFVPYNETINAPEGEQKTFKYLVIGEDVYPLFFGKAEAENSVYSEETSAIKIFGEETPLKLRVGTYTAYVEKYITRSPETAVSELRKQQENYEANFLSDIEIVNCEEKYFPEEDGVRLILSYTLRGDIAKPSPIEFGNTNAPVQPES